MKNTREEILLVSLRLFARRGYAATSVSDIAGELGISKGALYRHYKNKRDIFDSIVARMEERDRESAQEHGLPEGEKREMEDKYLSTEAEQLLAFSRERFDFWTQDEFASLFRKMLTIERFCDEEMNTLYDNYIGKGPLEYTKDLLAGMGVSEAEGAALCFYAPMVFLYGVYDSGDTKLARELAEKHFSTACCRILKMK